MADAADAGDRYEFRSWFRPDGAPRILFDDWTDETGERPERRRDTYLLPRGRPWLLPKIRDGQRFEVKRLVEIDGRGLELWEVIASAAFPLDADALDLAAETFGASRWSEGPDGRSADALRTWALGAPDAIATIDVDKVRRRFSRGSLLGERTEAAVVPSGPAVVTIAIESASADRLAAFVSDSGLSTLPNLGYGAFLSYWHETGVLPVSRAPAQLQPEFP